MIKIYIYVKIIFLVVKSIMLLTETWRFSCELKKLMGVYDTDDVAAHSSFLIGQTDSVTTIPGLPYPWQEIIPNIVRLKNK